MKVKPAAVPLVALAVGGALIALVPGAASAAPKSPKTVTATRDASDAHKIKIGWDDVPGVARYNVSVFDGESDQVSIVPASSHTLDIIEPDACKRLRINVGSRDKSGAGATSYNYWLNSLAPSGVSNLKATRNAAGTSLTASWKAPTWMGYGTSANFRVQLLKADKSVAFDGTVTDATATLNYLDPAKEYTLQVTPQNTYGSCFTGKLAIGNLKPNAVGALAVARDAANHRKVAVSWAAPSYTGSGAISHYTVGYGQGATTDWIRVDGNATTLDLDENSEWVVQVLAHNALGSGKPSFMVKVPGNGTIGKPVATPSTLPGLTLGTVGAKIQVKLPTRVGANKEYPNVVVRVKPAIDDDGYTEEQYGSPSATTINVGDVPNGLYLVTVSGGNNTRETEWARQWINVGNTGLIGAADWKILTGKLTVNAGSVVADGKYDTKLWNSTARSTNNQAVTSTVTLTTGRGFGFWVRSSNNSTKTSGYLLEYDTAYVAGSQAAKPAMVLRMYYNNTQCATPLQVTALTPELLTNSAHKVVILVKGDTLYASIDNSVIFNVPSLASAVTGAKCKYALPTGTDVGLKTWKGAAVTFANTAVN